MKELEKIRKEYQQQDSDGTAYPYYFVVQELRTVGVLADGYGVCENGQEECEWVDRGDSEMHFNSLDEAREYYSQDDGMSEDEIEDAIENLEELNIGKVWMDVEIFLTRKAAEEFIKADAHNLGKTRIYAKWISYKNLEMRQLFEILKLIEGK